MNSLSFIKSKHLFFLLFLLFVSCKKETVEPVADSDGLFSASGVVTDSRGQGIEGVKLFYNSADFTITDQNGLWTISNLKGEHTITPSDSSYSFVPVFANVDASVQNIDFSARRILSENEQQVFNWFDNQQLPNGLVPSAENGNFVSLYDNALAAMVFMLRGDHIRAARIFDFFDGRINSELKSGVGGFSQFRDGNGVPSNHRWMGDNAWLLIAINNYKLMTGSNRYDHLAGEIAQWLMKLQDTDGGLFAGYDADGQLLNYKVTEGNIDAFNAIDGYNDFHKNLLTYLRLSRWVPSDKNLASWPGNPQYLYALDLHSWSYAIFPDYPYSALTTADRFLNTQTATISGNIITGYCFDEDQDVVWPEGMGQMALAFHLAKQQSLAVYYLNEMEKVLIESATFSESKGFPYAANMGTTYGADELWEGADLNIALSGGAWYLFAKFGFNPFEVGRNKEIPIEDQFWLE